MKPLTLAVGDDSATIYNSLTLVDQTVGPYRKLFRRILWEKGTTYGWFREFSNEHNCSRSEIDYAPHIDPELPSFIDKMPDEEVKAVVGHVLSHLFRMSPRSIAFLMESFEKEDLSKPSSNEGGKEKENLTTDEPKLLYTWEQVKAADHPLMRRLRHYFWIRKITKVDFVTCVVKYYHRRERDAETTNTGSGDVIRAMDNADVHGYYDTFLLVLKELLHIDDYAIELILQDTGDGMKILEAAYGPLLQVPAVWLDDLTRPLVESGGDESDDARNANMRAQLDNRIRQIRFGRELFERWKTTTPILVRR